MFLNLKKYLSSDGIEESIQYQLKIEDVDVNGVNPFSGPVSVSADLRSFNGSLLLDMTISYSLRLPCDRCNDTTEQQKTQKATHIIVNELGDDEDEDGLYILAEEERFDLDELVHADVVLDLPVKFLCSPDCKGLCPNCGKNLNAGDCGCETNETDPRLEALRQLLD